MSKTGGLMAMVGVMALLSALAGSGKAQGVTPAMSGTQGKPEGTIKASTDVVTSSGELPLSAFVDLGHAVKMEFVLIRPGSFMMGSAEANSWNEEKPVHKVTIAKPFYLGKYLVTQAQWQAVMGTNPSYFKGHGSLPVESVSWDDCQQFTQKVGQDVRLPSEAEWEYACRAGSTTAYYWGASMNDGHCWYSGNSGSKTHPVGQKTANAWGLFDMSGNVWEWCQDWYHNDYSGAPSDGTAWELPADFGRVLRGGAWGLKPGICRSACRSMLVPTNLDDNIGVRCARTVRS